MFELEITRQLLKKFLGYHVLPVAISSVTWPKAPVLPRTARAQQLLPTGGTQENNEKHGILTYSLTP